MTLVEQKRWKTAQSSELQYWDSINVPELLRISAEKPHFLELLDASKLESLFADKEVLEIGVGPLGISIASFYSGKDRINRLAKLEPLPQIPLSQSPAMEEVWATPFLHWLQAMSEEGEYIQSSGETIGYQNEFDTVIIFNVLDHVQDPFQILENAYKSLRKGGQILVGVDCRSVLGRLKFEYFNRQVYKGTIMVDAHPHTFLPSHVVSMLGRAGFEDVRTFGAPSTWGRLMSKTFRPAFIGKKA